jgi:hypothetical protein
MGGLCRLQLAHQLADANRGAQLDLGHPNFEVAVIALSRIRLQCRSPILMSAASSMLAQRSVGRRITRKSQFPAAKKLPAASRE